MSKDNHCCGEGCDHDHDHDHEHQHETIVITLDGEVDLECNVIGSIDVNEKEYVALQPLDEDEVLFFRFYEEDGNIQLENIESDEEYQEVTEAFFDLFEDEDDGEDYDEDEDFDDDDGDTK